MYTRNTDDISSADLRRRRFVTVFFFFTIITFYFSFFKFPPVFRTVREYFLSGSLSVTRPPAPPCKTAPSLPLSLSLSRHHSSHYAQRAEIIIQGSNWDGRGAGVAVAARECASL